MFEKRSVFFKDCVGKERKKQDSRRDSRYLYSAGRTVRFEQHGGNRILLVNTDYEIHWVNGG
jgi:hypothetical protein